MTNISLIDYDTNEVITTATSKSFVRFVMLCSLCTGDNYICGRRRYVVVNKEVNDDDYTISIHMAYIGIEPVSDTQSENQIPHEAPIVNN